MNELDHIWSQMLSAAEAKAADAGRNDVVEYLRLKAANDAIRGEAVGWIIDVFAELVADVARNCPTIVVEREHPHRFERGASRMVGSLFRVRSGVRCLSLEAGWTRTPSDGIMLMVPGGGPTDPFRDTASKCRTLACVCRRTAHLARRG
ncbi:MAG: hypothetical protein IPP63_07790 [Chloracidobacterium sp.]|nr:hypothetical protein [Chloracidobacterium sp.]